MKHILVLLLLLAVLSMLLIFACNKEPLINQDKLPRITSLAPLLANNDQVVAADSIELGFLLSDDKQLSLMSLQLTDQQGVTVFAQQERIADALYVFHQWIHFVASPFSQRYTLHITAVDNHLQVVSKSIVFFLKP